MTLAVPLDIELDSNEEALSLLPLPLKSFIQAAVYCTILYDDEIHPIGMFVTQSTPSDDLEEAKLLTTIAEREGRSVAIVGDYELCFEFSRKFQENSPSRHPNLRSLRTGVLHAHLVAHQSFALEVLDWMKNLLEKGGAPFRRVFGEVAENVVVDKVYNCGFLKGLMLHDAKVWKKARTKGYHLVVGGMLKDWEMKKRFAKVLIGFYLTFMVFSWIFVDFVRVLKIFVENYGVMLKDFVADDHSRSFSIIELSAQLFKVPSIAHYLIESQNVISMLMGTFKKEWQRFLNPGKKAKPF